MSYYPVRYELGFALTSPNDPPEEVDKDWEYFAFPANVKPQFLPCGDGNSELVLMVRYKPDHYIIHRLNITPSLISCRSYAKRMWR